MAEKKDPVQEYLDSFDPSQFQTGTLSPIGVPEMIRTPGGDVLPFEANGVEPRYFEGDDWAPAAMSPEDRARLQRLMASAGIIPRGAEYREGLWDDTSRAAYRDVLTQANASGMTPQQVIAEWANSSTVNRAAANPYLAPDLASIQSDIKAVFRKRLGRDLTDGELPALVSEALSLDRQAYDTNSAITEAGGTQFDPAARFEDYLSDQYKPEIQRVEGMTELRTNTENLMGSIFQMDQAIA